MPQVRPLALFALVLLALLSGACGERETPEKPSMSEAPTPPAPAEGDPAPSPDVPAASTAALATFGNGCFWCTEAVFQALEGVLEVTSGYSGGTVDDPTYEQVCSGATGHAEGVQIRYDPARVSYADLLRVFFLTHDPTTRNRQGADVGTQYRSVIFFHTPAQKAEAERVVEGLDASDAYPSPIVTEIVPFERFFEAETYHQDFFALNPTHRYCQAVIQPKLEKFRAAFGEGLRAD